MTKITYEMELQDIPNWTPRFEGANLKNGVLVPKGLYYERIWEDRDRRIVANVGRQDSRDYTRIQLRVEVVHSGQTHTLWDRDFSVPTLKLAVALAEAMGPVWLSNIEDSMMFDVVDPEASGEAA